MGLLIGVGNTKPEFAYDYYYGIEWDKTVSNPVPTRIGKSELHAELPLQSKMRRCILKDDGTVNYYLHPNDSTKRDTGANADLTGADGQYMDELPDAYMRFEEDGNKCRCLMSPHPLPGFKLWRKDYISAVEATVQRGATPKLSAVVNNSAEYRGGNNNSSLDGTPQSQLGLPATVISLTNFRNYAHNRGANWYCQIYKTYKKLWWFFAVEYCTFNTQTAFNAALDANGYRQGGLGAGVTNLGYDDWNTFNGTYPFVPCGHTNSLGNKTGCVDFTMPDAYTGSGKVESVPSYRGVENPFGHIYKWTDGLLVKVQSEEAGGKSLLYACDNPADGASTFTDNYKHIGDLPRTEGYIKEIMLGDDGEILPRELGGSTSTYFCDKYYTYNPDSGTSTRGVLFGGSAANGTNAGFLCATTTYSPSVTAANFGSRLCYYPQIEGA